MAKGNDTLNAGAIYHAVLDEAIKGYDDMVFEMDDNGDIAVVIDDIAKGLGECLEKSEADTNTRLAWFESLLCAELADIKLGGIDLAPSALAAVLKSANKEEWQWIEERLSDNFRAEGKWANETIQKFLAKGRKKHGINI